MRKFCMPVAAGDRVFARMLGAQHRCIIQLFALIFDKDGRFVVGPVLGAGGRPQGGIDGLPSNFDSMGTYYDVVAANAAYMAVLVRMRTTGEANPYVFWTELMMGKLAPGQTVLPPYTDGPADPVADQTSAGTAAGIAGQGAFATLNSAGYGSSLLTGFGNIAQLSNISFGDGFLLESPGVQATNANYKTISGTAAAITNQGTLATKSNVALGSEVTGVPTFVTDTTPRPGFTGQQAVRNDYVIDTASGTALTQRYPAEFGSNVTETRTASAIVSQGALATKGSVAYGSSFVTGFSTLASMSSVYLGSSFVTETAGGAQVTVAGYKTSQGVAASVAGQGTLATKNNVGLYSDITGLPPFLTDTTPRPGFPTQASVRNDYVIDGASGTALSARYPAEAGSNVTETRTAAALAGQGTLATKSSVDMSSSEITNRYARYVFYGTETNQVAVSLLRPAEVGSNVTETRTAAAITGQNYGATAPEAAVSNARVPLGSNSVVNSGFKRGNYGFTANTSLSSGINLNADYSGMRQVPYSSFSGTLEGGQSYDCWATKCPWGATGLAAGTVDDMRKFCMPVVAGERVFGRTLAAAHRCGFQLYALFFNAAGTFVSGPSLGGTARSGGAQNGDPANFDLCGNYVDAPATGYMALMVRMNGNGGANPYVFWTEPMMGKLAAGQTVLPPYTDGPSDPIADQTGTNTAAAVAGQGALATVNSVAITDASRVTGVPTFVTDPTSRPGFPGQTAVRNDYVIDSASGTALATRYPAEAGSNKTETRTAAAIVGQGAIATAGTISRTNVASYFNYSSFSLGYSITRSDGVNTVTESMAITQLGIASGFAGQGTLATLNQADTAQIAANAVSNFQSVNISIGSVSAGGGADSDPVTIATNGGRVRLEASVDTVRTGTGTNAATIQFILVPAGGSEVIIGRSVYCNAVENGPPVYYTTTTGLPAGTYAIKIRMLVSNGKGTNSWSIPAGTLGVEETKR